MVLPALAPAPAAGAAKTTSGRPLLSRAMSGEQSPGRRAGHGRGRAPGAAAPPGVDEMTIGRADRAAVAVAYPDGHGPPIGGDGQARLAIGGGGIGSDRQRGAPGQTIPLRAIDLSVQRRRRVAVHIAEPGDHGAAVRALDRQVRLGVGIGVVGDGSGRAPGLAVPQAVVDLERRQRLHQRAGLVTLRPHGQGAVGRQESDLWIGHVATAAR